MLLVNDKRSLAVPSHRSSPFRVYVRPYTDRDGWAAPGFWQRVRERHADLFGKPRIGPPEVRAANTQRPRPAAPPIHS